jgi:cyclic beta-1,2-glucan synthetase
MFEARARYQTGEARSLGIRSLVHASGFLAAIALSIVAFALLLAGLQPSWREWGLALLAALVASDVAVLLVDEAGLLLQRRRDVHAFEFARAGLPDDCRTAIVVPMLIQSSANFRDVLATAERNYRIANDSNVAMVLLADFIDSASARPSLAEEALLQEGRSLVAELNAQYARHDGDAFLLLVRNRELAAVDGQWRGHERKRGKLEAFSALVRGRRDAFIDGRSAVPVGRFRYALCIDEDTKLGRDCVQRLVGALAHPLNAPIVTEVDGRPNLVQGHAAAAPAIFACRADVGRHRLPGLMASMSIDADVKASLAFESTAFEWFGVELNRGKLLIDIAAHDTLAHGRYPEGVLLSHDTVESDALRPLFVGNAVVAESVPDSMLDSAERSHRWMRGDIQNFLIYLCGYRRISPIGLHWKIVILHQVRNLTLPIATLSLGLWCSIEGVGKAMQIVFWSSLLLPSMTMVVIGVLRNPRRGRRWSPTAMIRNAAGYAIDVAFRLSCVPLMAFVAVHAALMVGRSTITKRGLLQWRASSSVQAHSDVGRFAHALDTLGASATCLLAWIAWTGRLSATSLVLLLTWALSPIIVRRVRKRATVRSET